MEPDLFISRRGELVTEEIEGDLVGLNADRGQVFGFSKTARYIWELLAEPVSMPQLLAAVAARYRLGEHDVEGEIRAFLCDLEAHELIEMTHGTSAAAQ